ncbi:PAS domain-containing sensor histidine kinase [Algibacter marinivivus]|uniref:histidine kinase n=1 Tax=Algibacter marinivivus TaxID=2100723 RepID=A0A2U2X2M0_9FLAO|nr:ATP-binding protein [Algibacter marinivivus]PWH82017.1 PAS domain-containing sensor histidine kinase [Algibacter marinivivus]
MSQDKIDMLQRALAREKAARKQAEKILENKSAELYDAKQKLEKSYSELETLLNKTDSQLQGVFENIVDAYVIIDLTGNVLKMNDAAVGLLGFEDSNQDFNLIEMVHPNELERVAESFKYLFNNGTLTDFNVIIITRKKEEKLVHINASIIYDNGSPVAAQGIVRDVTELKTLEIQKEKLLKKLEKSNDELQEYAHIVSHDLKSPLRSIDALVNWIKDDNKDKLDEVSLQNFKLIETTLEKMEQLISDVLSYSSVGTNESEKVNVNLDEVITDLIEIMYKPDHVTVEVLNKLPTLRGDKTKLQQLFQNLISNAIKFIDKEKGFVKINVENLQTHYQFSIADNGMGIEKKFHDKIFKIFHSLNKSKDSTGIGLSIVKKIIDLHEGEIWLESEPGKGTTFFFTLKK